MAKVPSKAAKKSSAKSPKKPGAEKSTAFQPATPATPLHFGVGVWPSAGFTSPTTPKSMESIMNKSQSQFDAFSKDQGAAMKDSMEAMMKSSKIYAERFQNFMNTYMEMCQDASAKQANAMKNLMTCKTINEITEAQSKMAQSSFDDMMQAMTKMTEMGVKLTTEAMEPLNDQVGKAIKKATDSMAA